MPQNQEIINRLLRQSAEVITPEEFKERLSKGKELTHYIGFEISGYVHIGQGIMSALIIKDLVDLGVQPIIWLADWHSWINNKLDGTKETAARIGEGYFTEAIKAAYVCVGGNPDDIEFRLASNWYAKDMMGYMNTAMRIMQKTTDSRIKRSIDIMGRQMGGDVEMARLMYPAMQVADVFYQDIDLVHAGTDQRKAYVIMRDVAKKLYPDKPKPVVILHQLLPGLSSAEGKMSKSNPEEALFIHDSVDHIKRKVAHAFCPERVVEKNPVLMWTRHLLFWNRVTPFCIERKPEHGGDIEFNVYKELEVAYKKGDVHPMDLKSAVAKEITALLAPAREHFAQPEVAVKKEELDKILTTR